MIQDKYRIIRELGRGGEGKVYLVQHRVTEQFRAAKVLKNTTGRRRFQEINAMKRLEHRGLPQIYDVLEEQDQIWLILEYVKGRCLHELSREECSRIQFFSIAEQLAEILVYLHTRPAPVFHLDIKPSNLLLKEDGTLVLIDFGAAVRQNFGMQSADRAAGVVLTECFGTPGFAAPEQFSGGKVDGRSDLYGAGAVLYYYLFHKTPDKGPMEARIMRYQLLRERRIGNLALLGIVRHCLKKEPSERFQDAFAFQKAVKKARCRYERTKTAGSITAACMLLCGMIFFSIVQWKESEGENVEKNTIIVQQTEDLEQKYAQLLDRAGKFGFGQAVDCYEEALKFADGDLQWLQQLLERIMADCSFDLEEEDALKQLLFQIDENSGQTILEQIHGTFEYGEIAYKIGLAYWYYYEESGGKSAAVDWFVQALSAGQKANTEEKSWYRSAQVYAKIGSYYEKLGKKDTNGNEQASIVIYWEDLKMLWQMEDRSEQSEMIQRRLAEELLSCMIFDSYQLKEGGKNKEELDQVWHWLEIFQEQGASFNQELSCEAARAAIERTYQEQNEKNRRMEWDEEDRS